MTASTAERKFLAIWRRLGGPKLTEEVRFHPTRRWRFDFAHAETKVAIEIEGGAWSRGRHTRGAGFIGDCQKYNAATLLGWRVFRLAGADIVDAEKIGEIAAFVEGEK